VELHLDKPPLVPLYNVLLWVIAAPLGEAGYTRMKWRRTGDCFQRWLLAVFTFLVCRIRTSTAVTKCARSNDARQGVPIGHSLLRA
jgi:hypothetical protein